MSKLTWEVVFSKQCADSVDNLTKQQLAASAVDRKIALNGNMWPHFQI